MHRGRSDTAANAIAKSDAPRKFASEFLATKSQRKSCELSAAREFAIANVNGFANEIVKIFPEGQGHTN